MITDSSVEIKAMIEEAKMLAFTRPEISIQKIDEAILRAEKEELTDSLARALETKGTLSINMQRTADARVFFERAAGLWKGSGKDAEYIYTLNSLAIAHLLQCDWVESETMLNECLQRSIELKNENLRAITLSNFANYYIRKNDFEKAVECSVNSISLLQSLHQYERLLPAVINLGVVYGFLKDDDKALQMYERALPMLEKCTDKNNLVNLYVNLGELYVRRKESDKALALLLNAHKLANQYQYQRGIAYTATTLGNIYAQKGDTSLAYNYLASAVELLEQLNDHFVLPQLYLDTAKLFTGTSETEKSIGYLEKALHISKQHNLLYQQMESCARLATIHQQLKNYELGCFYLNSVTSLREKIFTEEKAKSIVELQAKYEVEQKSREAEQLRGEAAEFNLKFLRSQMNPHFIFNSVNSINNFILKRDSKQASEYLLKFAKLMRAILDNSSLALITIEKEIQFLTDYLTLESLRFNIPFTFSFKTDKNLDVSELKIPPMLLQPYVENAVWHGIAHLQSQGNIRISFCQTAGKLVCTIEDNGVGRQKAAALENGIKKHESKALHITKQRLNLLNREAGEAVDVNIVDLKDKKNEPLGTRVEITLPLTFS